VIGVNVSIETLKDWSNIISQVSEPTVIPEIRDERIDEKQIIIIQIQEYPLKPVAIRGRCFRRVATSNRQMSPQEIAHMHLQSTGNSWDALVARDNALDAIDIEKVERYIKVSTANGRRKFSLTEDRLQILSKLELIKTDGPTWASVLLFGIRPQSPLTQAQVHCGRFKNSVTIIDNRLIERYGSGIQRMINACIESGLPEPTFEEKFGGFQVTFRKNIYNKESLNRFDLNERQVNALMFIKETGKITNKEYQKITGIKDRIATMELNDLVSKNLLERVGTTGRGTFYILNKAAKGALKTH
jgi:predicted HTH transcriptional regulator